MANVIENILKVRNSESYIKYQEYHMNNFIDHCKNQLGYDIQEEEK